MTKEEVIEQLCCICTGIANKLDNHSEPHDCFCSESDTHENCFQFSQKWIDFIRDAVDEKIKNDKIPKYLGDPKLNPYHNLLPQSLQTKF